MEESSYDDPYRPTVYCPRCGVKTDRIQAFRTPVFIFAIFYFASGTEKIVGCTDCVRSALIQRLLLSIPLTNVFCWIFVPWHLIEIISCYIDDRPGIPPEYAYLANEQPHMDSGPTWKGKTEGRALRLIIVLLILAAIVGAVFFVLPRITSR
jgi:hypothetical protein